MSVDIEIRRAVDRDICALWGIEYTPVEYKDITIPKEKHPVINNGLLLTDQSVFLDKYINYLILTADLPIARIEAISKSDFPIYKIEALYKKV